MAMSNNFYITHKTYLKGHFFTLILRFLVTSITLSIIPSSFAANKLDEIAVVVNDDVIMLSEVYSRARQLKSQRMYAQLPQKTLLKEALELSILDKLQTQRAKKMGITVNDEMLNRAMQGLAKQNKLTLAQLKIAVVKEGLSYKTVRENIRQRILISQLKRSYQQSTAANDNLAINDIITNKSDILSKNISYKFQHILFPQKKYSRLPEVNTLKQYANTIRQRIIKGEDFLSFPNAETDTAWISATTLSPSFLRILNTLQKGQLSPVFHDSQGFHLLKLTDKQGEQQDAVEEFNIRHILIKPKNNQNDDEVRATIAKIRQKIIAGESFAALAQKNSDDKGSSARGGDLGWATLDRYVPPFAAMARRSAIKQVSPPFKTQFGWHILEILEKRKSTKTTNSLRRQARKLLDKNQTDNAYANWIQELRNTAFVDYKINF